MTHYFRTNKKPPLDKSPVLRRPLRPRRRRREDDNVDAWLMTYADMITLIVCFFAILLSISAPKREEIKNVQSSLAQEFSGRSKANNRTPFVTPIGQWDANLPPTGLSTLYEEDEKPAPPTPKKPAGDRLQIVDMNSGSSFAAGSATLSDEGQKVLDGVFQTLQSSQYKDYKITVEGHTDDTPISTAQFPSNWELSTARAAAVARYLLKMGVDPQRIRASGYADTFPKVPNHDAQGKPLPENQAQNRRVVIKLEKIEKDAP